jgi:phosphoglucosamine mutase
MKETGRTLADLGACMVRFPQILVNVKVRERKPFEEIPALQERMDSYHTQLSSDGRILLRYSGTELLARVMVEGRNRELIETIAHSIADHIRQDIGLETKGAQG